MSTFAFRESRRECLGSAFIRELTLKRTNLKRTLFLAQFPFKHCGNEASSVFAERVTIGYARSPRSSGEGSCNRRSSSLHCWPLVRPAANRIFGWNCGHGVRRPDSSQNEREIARLAYARVLKVVPFSCTGQARITDQVSDCQFPGRS
jgi:hypothetical protein